MPAANKRLTAKCTWVLQGRRDGSRRPYCEKPADPEPVRIGEHVGVLCPAHTKAAYRRKWI